MVLDTQVSFGSTLLEFLPTLLFIGWAYWLISRQMRNMPGGMGGLGGPGECAMHGWGCMAGSRHRCEPHTTCQQALGGSGGLNWTCVLLRSVARPGALPGGWGLKLRDLLTGL